VFSQQNYFVMNALNEIVLKWKMLGLRVWRILHTKDPSFITSSIGLGFDSTGNGDTITIGDKDALIYFPLSATIALEVSRPVHSAREMDVEHINATAFAARHINKLVAFNANKFVFANNDKFHPPKGWCQFGMSITPAKPLPVSNAATLSTDTPSNDDSPAGIGEGE
jgi:hypothetical protein